MYFKKLLSLILAVLLPLTGGYFPRPAIAQNKEEYTIAVLNFDAKGISETEAGFLSESLRGEVTRVTVSSEFYEKTGIRYKVIERSQMDKILDEFEIQSTGCTDIECALEFGKMFSAERIIIGSIGLVGETYSITARIVDVETSETLGFADFTYTGKRDELLKTGVSEVVNELMYGVKKKKSRKMYYVLGGVVVTAGVLGLILSGGGDNSGTGSDGSIAFTIPVPQD
ncbi:MAG: hypothetical protein JXB48_23265 [Candidatus Latescibacteria bacterium]|nr:hypothetical protein [Candidatus Latescibacterota bacterium]